MVEESEKPQGKPTQKKEDPTDKSPNSSESPPLKKLKLKKKLKNKTAKMNIAQNLELDGTYTFKRIRGDNKPVKYVIDINHIPFDVTVFKDRLDTQIDSRVILKFGKPSQLTIKSEQGEDTSLTLTIYNVHFFNQKAELLFKTPFVYNANWVISKIIKEGTSYYIIFEQKRIELSGNWVSRLKDTYLFIKKDSEKEYTIYDFKGNYQMEFFL